MYTQRSVISKADLIVSMMMRCCVNLELHRSMTMMSLYNNIATMMSQRTGPLKSIYKYNAMSCFCELCPARAGVSQLCKKCAGNASANGACECKWCL